MIDEMRGARGHTRPQRARVAVVATMGSGLDGVVDFADVTSSVCATNPDACGGHGTAPRVSLVPRAPGPSAWSPVRRRTATLLSCVRDARESAVCPPVQLGLG